VPEFLKKYLSQEQFDLLVSTLASESSMSLEQFNSISATLFVAMQAVSNQIAAIPQNLAAGTARSEDIRMLARESEGLAMVFDELANKIGRGVTVQASEKVN
jgi:Golgi nucleoside diphosphatase